jgi:hypothetical protein
MNNDHSRKIFHNNASVIEAKILPGPAAKRSIRPAAFEP